MKSLISIFVFLLVSVCGMAQEITYQTFIYTSDEYNKLYPETFETMKKNKEQYFTNDLMYEVVCNLLQITSNHYNTENSILSPDYKFNQNNLTTMLGKRKLTEDTNQ